MIQHFFQPNLPHQRPNLLGPDLPGPNLPQHQKVWGPICRQIDEVPDLPRYLGGAQLRQPPHGLQICSNRLVLVGLISVLVCPPEIAINVVQDQLLLEPLLPLRDNAQVEIHGQGSHLHTGHLSFLVFDKISTPFQLPSSSRAIAECRRGLPLD